jgi:hypothetical protein
VNAVKKKNRINEVNTLLEIRIAVHVIKTLSRYMRKRKNTEIINIKLKTE